MEAPLTNPFVLALAGQIVLMIFVAATRRQG
jgi:hypothetical protein